MILWYFMFGVKILNFLGKWIKKVSKIELNLVFLLISNLITWLRLHKFLGTYNTDANKSIKIEFVISVYTMV